MKKANRKEPAYRPGDLVPQLTLEGVPLVPYEGERPRANAAEFEAMAFMGRLYIGCHRGVGKVLYNRLKKTPGAWQKYKSGVALLGRAANAALSTIPADQQDRMMLLFTRGKLRIDMPKPLEDAGKNVVVDGDALAALCAAAMQGACSVCLEEGKRATRCPVYKALCGVIEPDSWETYGCVWRDQALRDREQSEKK